MAIEAPGAALFSFEAGGDLSALQYHFVKLNSTGKVVAITAITDKPIGILQNKPSSGEAATVMLHGISRLVMDEAVTPGDVVGPSADGQGDGEHAQPVGHCVIGTSAAAEVGSVAFNCTIPWQTAIA